MVYGRYTDILTMVYKPTNITGGHHLESTLSNPYDYHKWVVKNMKKPPPKGSVLILMDWFKGKCTEKPHI